LQPVIAAAPERASQGPLFSFYNQGWRRRRACARRCGGGDTCIRSRRLHRAAVAARDCAAGFEAAVEGGEGGGWGLLLQRFRGRRAHLSSLRRLDGGAGRETWRQQRRRRAAGGGGGVRLRAGARQRFKKNSGLSRSCARLSNPVPLFLARLKRRPPTPHDCQFVLSSRSIALSLPAPASAGL
jgi:hypothetical protein